MPAEVAMDVLKAAPPSLEITKRPQLVVARPARKTGAPRRLVLW
jgi:hypothetical protein